MLAWQLLISVESLSHTYCDIDAAMLQASSRGTECSVAVIFVGREDKPHEDCCHAKTGLCMAWLDCCLVAQEPVIYTSEVWPTHAILLPHPPSPLSRSPSPSSQAEHALKLATRGAALICKQAPAFGLTDTPPPSPPIPTTIAG